MRQLGPGVSTEIETEAIFMRLRDIDKPDTDREWLLSNRQIVRVHVTEGTLRIGYRVPDVIDGSVREEITVPLRAIFEAMALGSWSDWQE